jgi:hypothetical protein
MSDAAEAAPRPPEEPKMEVHKPKPVHNWRELLTEIGVIVIGVAIALAAEQGVEWLHWQGEVKTARAALRAEMTAIVDFYAARTAAADCMDKRLDAAAAMIADAAAGRVPDAGRMPFNGMGRLLSDSEWQSERASQTLTHFPRGELALMSRFYAQMLDVRGWEGDETTAWSQLAVLRDASQKLGPPDLAQLRINYHLARRYYNTITLNAGRQLALAAQLGIRPTPLSQARLTSGCTQSTYRKY